MIASIHKYVLTQSRLKNSEEIVQLLNSEREKERLNISSYLHDTILQEIGSILLTEEMRENEKLSAELRHISDNLRNLTYSIAPLHLNKAGLVEGITELAADFETENGISTTLTVNALNEELISDEVRLVYYRITQEALNNIRKHSEATAVSVKLVASHPYLILRIRDNGKGFDNTELRNESRRSEHLGMRLMHEQARNIGAVLIGESAPGAGTEISIKYHFQNDGRRYSDIGYCKAAVHQQENR
ncbi:MAG: hypothetical protein PQJ61_08885 [Spirochaetales bacterium]|uniref:Histidine kinase/HSP90-like ATPase domain-containing protein n=1 Tax=Candidatus Thalassospirochaeta sargassi TaxID=3119039 RepID=A0AAJ1IEV0_9SPIO|nr:hypothetical protein [Spirochaetales bacterium]